MSGDVHLFPCVNGPMDGELSDLEFANNDTLIRGISKACYDLDGVKAWYWRWTPSGEKPQKLAIYKLWSCTWRWSTMRQIK
jgi:hypothetical protein